MSFTGLKNINSSEVNLDGQLRLSSDLLAGTSGQVIESRGDTESAVWANPASTAVPNPLTMGTNVSLTSGNATWDGSIADTLNSTDTDTQLNLTGGNGISVANTGGLNRTITTDNDGTTINNTGGTGAQNQVLKVPNALTINGTTYDGSVARSFTLPVAPIPNADLQNSSLTLGSTTCTLGTTTGTIEDLELDSCLGITMDGANIDLDGGDVVGIDDLTFQSSAGASAMTGNAGSGGPTTMTNFDLSDTSNIVSPYFFHNVYDPAVSDFDALSTTYSALFLSNVNVNIVAKQTALCVELLCFNYGSSSNRFTYCRLTDNGGTEFSSGTNQGGYGTGTINTERLVHGMDETDKQIFRITWYIQGLTKGNTYTFNPQARTSGTFNYIAAGGSYPACILRGYYLPSAGI